MTDLDCGQLWRFVFMLPHLNVNEEAVSQTPNPQKKNIDFFGPVRCFPPILSRYFLTCAPDLGSATEGGVCSMRTDLRRHASAECPGEHDSSMLAVSQPSLPDTEACEPVPCQYEEAGILDAGAAASRVFRGAPQKHECMTKTSTREVIAGSSLPVRHQSEPVGVASKSLTKSRNPEEHNRPTRRVSSPPLRNTFTGVFREHIQADLLRTVSVGRVLRSFGAIFSNHIGSEADFRLSQKNSHIDFFISHSWTARWYLKHVSLSFMFNLRSALLASWAAVLLLIVASVLVHFSSDVFERRHSWSVPRLVMPVAGWLVFFLVLFFLPRVRRKNEAAFLDKCCINQTDERAKREGVMCLGAFLRQSKSMVVLWSQDYFLRLWCVYELACFLHVRQAEIRAEARRELELRRRSIAVRACAYLRDVWADVLGDRRNTRVHFLPMTTIAFVLLQATVGCVANVILLVQQYVADPDDPALQKPDTQSSFSGLVRRSWSLPVSSFFFALVMTALVVKLIRDQEALRAQINNFSIQSAKCTLPSDRDMLLHNIKQMYSGSLEEFESFAKSSMKEPIVDAVGARLNTLPFRYILVLVQNECLDILSQELSKAVSGGGFRVYDVWHTVCWVSLYASMMPVFVWVFLVVSRFVVVHLCQPPSHADPKERQTPLTAGTSFSVSRAESDMNCTVAAIPEPQVFGSPMQGVGVGEGNDTASENRRDWESSDSAENGMAKPQSWPNAEEAFSVCENSRSSAVSIDDGQVVRVEADSVSLTTENSHPSHSARSRRSGFKNDAHRQALWRTYCGYFTLFVLVFGVYYGYSSLMFLTAYSTLDWYHYLVLVAQVAVSISVYRLPANCLCPIAF